MMAFSVYLWVCLCCLLSVAIGGAPGDADEFCLPASGEVESLPLPPNVRVLMDSYNYIVLLGELGVVWQQVDLDDNNAEGRGTQVSS